MVYQLKINPKHLKNLEELSDMNGLLAAFKFNDKAPPYQSGLTCLREEHRANYKG